MSAVVDGTRWEAATPTALLGGLAGLTSLVSCSVYENLATRFWLASPFATGSTCTITLTAHSPTRVAGVFSFTAVAGPGVSPSARTVTSGVFDLSQ